MLKKESEHYTIPLSEEAPVTLHPWTHVLKRHTNGRRYRSEGGHDKPTNYRQSSV